jgi:large conductance mechanosensitive channel
MAKEKKAGKVSKFFAEFKKFITRGNVLDMAVGVIVGGAFTAIVNGLSNFILKPLINWLIALLLGKEGLSGAITMLSPAYDEAGAVVLADSIYIDWGSFISAIINFFLIAFVLFSIVRIMNKVRETNDRIEQGLETVKNEQKAIKKIRKEQKVSYKQAQEIYAVHVEELKAKNAEEEAKKAEIAAAEAAAAEAKANANTRLLEEIRDLLKNK